jgi:two-component system, cell cycle sensor histidine kinase and response regulator CckA
MVGQSHNKDSVIITSTPSQIHDTPPFLQAIGAAASTVATMTLFELVKQWLSPPITIWKSHFITICFTGLLSLVVSLIALKKFRSQALREANSRGAADLAELVRLETESQLQVFVEHAPAAIAMLDRNMNYLVVSRRWSVDFRLTEPSLVGRSHYEVFPEIPERWKQIHRRCLQGVSAKCEEDSFLRKDGRTEWSRWEIHPWRHRDGSVGGLIIFSEGITERKQAEQALRQAEQRYRSIFEEAIVGIFQSAPDGRYLSVNPALAKMLGYDSPQKMLESVTNISDQIYVDPKRREEFRQSMERQGVVKNFECEVFRRDGSKIWLSVNARAIYKDGVAVCYEGTNADITERKLLQEQLLQAQKMEAVGRLAGGVAHDFNNAIGVIIGYGTLLKDRLVGDDLSRRYADEIGKAGQRAASLTRQLLAFSRKQVLQPTVLDLNSIVADMDKMLRRLIGEDIQTTVVLDPKLGQVKADLGQIEQIIMNLAVNARDAMPHGGKLVIETRNAELDEADRAQHHYVQPGYYVMFSVTDTGCGMDEETRVHIFEPFFTTKELGKGTGLGLSTVYGIVKQSGGYIWADGEPGKGARFKVYLPRADASVQRRSVVDISKVPGGSETILLVEDDDSMRALTRTCLEGGGYRVLDVPNGEAAIELSKRTAVIHLLLTDVIMPGMNGRALADSLTSLRPELKRLYMSGYTDDLIATHGVLEPGIELLEKPFTREALLRKIRSILDTDKQRSNVAAV